MCRAATHLAIVSGLTMNYNGYDVVETTYETFALVVASRCFRFAYRLRGRAACPPDSPPLEVSLGDALSLSSTAATVRYERRSAASDNKRAARNRSAAHRRDREQADQGR